MKRSSRKFRGSLTLVIGVQLPVTREIYVRVLVEGRLCTLRIYSKKMLERRSNFVHFNQMCRFSSRVIKNLERIFVQFAQEIFIGEGVNFSQRRLSRIRNSKYIIFAFQSLMIF